jgi:hypothetical protein
MAKKNPNRQGAPPHFYVYFLLSFIALPTPNTVAFVYGTLILPIRASAANHPGQVILHSKIIENLNLPLVSLLSVW